VNILPEMLAQRVGANELAQQQAIDRRWRAYLGLLPDPLKVRKGKPNDNVRANYLRVTVAKGVRFLFGKPVDFEIDEATDKFSDEDLWLQDCWRANRFMTTLQKVATNGGVTGHAFVKLKPAEPFPRVIVLDPSTVTPYFDPEDIEQILGYRIQYEAHNPRSGRVDSFRQLIYAETGEDGRPAYWVIRDEVAPAGANLAGGATWTLVDEQPWPHAYSPIVDCQNVPIPNQFWGISDLEDDVVKLQEAIDFILSNVNRIIRYHAHPKLWGTGFTAKELKVDVDGSIVLPSADAKIGHLEMRSDLSSSIEFYKRMREALHEISQIPEAASGKLEAAGNVTSVALKMLYQPLVELTHVKRLTYGDLLTEVNRRCLDLGGHGDQHYTTIHWPDVVPQNPLEQAQTAQLWMQLGISPDTIQKMLGFNPRLEKKKGGIVLALEPDDGTTRPNTGSAGETSPGRARSGS
jgi:hypothetical protein